jgi:DHA3 family tetracycline resistance protein-like MFS transporter
MGQWTWEDQQEIAHALDIPPERTRVFYPAIDGAFGGREDMSIQIVLALAGFGLTRSFLVAVVLYWYVGMMRSIRWPLASTWFNQRIDDPQVRATMFSVRGQVDAVGQITSGPVVGMIGNASIRAALVASAAILSPVLPLYWIAIRRDE